MSLLRQSSKDAISASSSPGTSGYASQRDVVHAGSELRPLGPRHDLDPIGRGDLGRVGRGQVEHHRRVAPDLGVSAPFEPRRCSTDHPPRRSPRRNGRRARRPSRRASREAPSRHRIGVPPLRRRRASGRRRARNASRGHRSRRRRRPRSGSRAANRVLRLAAPVEVPFDSRLVPGCTAPATATQRGRSSSPISVSSTTCEP